jgi:hypothetical protein
LVVPLVGVVPHFPGMQFGLVAVVPMLNAETEVEPKAVKSSAAAIILMIFCMGFRSLFSIVWGIDLQEYFTSQIGKAFARSAYDFRN